jgi:2-polyprenyl-3-methyl-5-hydroxy-6-metoxy-1,4-benzoquinol methylase
MDTTQVTANFRLQQQHPLVPTSNFSTMEEYVGYLIHRKAYEEAANLVRGKGLLDWGCNNGYGIEILRDMGCANAAGLDVSPAAIAEARSRLGADIELILHDGATSLPSGKFEVVTSFQCIEHVSDHRSYLQAIVRVLKPGGLAIFTTPNAAIRIDPGMKPWNEFHVTEFRAHELRALLSPCFRNVKVRGLFAAEKIYRVEVDRCARARQAARGPSLRGVLRSITPPSVRKLIRSTTANGGAPDMHCSTADLYYKDSDLDLSLDLMAVCESW